MPTRTRSRHADIPLTRTEARFVDAYLANGGNGRQAAITAGLAAHSATCEASKLRRRPNVAAEIARRSADALGREPQAVVQQLAAVAFGDIRDVLNPETGEPLPPSQWPAHAAAMVASVDLVHRRGPRGTTSPTATRIRLHDKLRALETMARLLGMDRQRVELTGADGAPVTLSDADLRAQLTALGLRLEHD
ncbi:MAG TPA: terminase small subunit [Vicinamibacterales bacterium]|nr:terminase small subunit [Vicinamibacterales bacterium]